MARNELERVTEYFGTQAAAAAALGVTAMAFSQWKRRGVPVEVAIRIEQATSGAISKSALRPDIFPPDQEQAA